ncbi:hypothetical protein ACKKBF_B39025 [Auxenochlorella protothecoides x Auxenochlorella symbiontica]
MADDGQRPDPLESNTTMCSELSTSHDLPSGNPPAGTLEHSPLEIPPYILNPAEEGPQYALLLRDWIAEELQADAPSPLRVSLALGAVEAAFTATDGALLTASDLPALVATRAKIFQAWVSDVLLPRLESAQTAREKVQAAAAAVWTMLAAGSYSKDVLHAQHLHSFVALLTSSGGVKSAAKRQLDCAGVVITVYAACEVLAARHGHADLCGVRVQVSEDHCWLSLDGSGRRDAAVELTTSNAALRGLAPGAEAWSGWLYAGGRAHTLTQRQVIASLVVSVDPTVVNGRAKKERLDSALEKALERGQGVAAFCAQFEREIAMAQSSLEGAIYACAGAPPSSGLGKMRVADQSAELQASDWILEAGDASWNWYPFSCYAEASLGYVEAMAGADGSALQENVPSHFQLGLCALAAGGRVLAKYRHAPTDDQLYKDIDELLRTVKSAADAAVLHIDASALLTPLAVEHLLRFLDGLCLYYSGKPKPATWVATLLKVLASATPETRQTGASRAAAAMQSPTMRASMGMWWELKPRLLKPLFEAGESEGEGARRVKRARVVD